MQGLCVSPASLSFPWCETNSPNGPLPVGVPSPQGFPQLLYSHMLGPGGHTLEGCGSGRDGIPGRAAAVLALVLC